MADYTDYTDETLALPDGDVGYLRREGAGAGTVLFAHANGLNAGAYAPLLGALGGPETVIAPDLRGHGLTTLPAEPETLTRWDQYADDLVRIVRALAPEGPLTLAGHSMGAVSSLLAAAQGLDVVRVVMIEPVILPRAVRVLARSPLQAATRRRGIAGRAARRRDAWPDADAVRAQYEETGFFKGWDEAALAGYLARGLRETEDGVTLACAPAWEAASFAAQGHRFWRPLAAVAARVPVHVLAARGRSTVPSADGQRLARGGALTAGMEGTHMLPTERPRHVAAWVSMSVAGGRV